MDNKQFEEINREYTEIKKAIVSLYDEINNLNVFINNSMMLLQKLFPDPARSLEEYKLNSKYIKELHDKIVGGGKNG